VAPVRQGPVYVKDADGHDVGWWDLVENAGYAATSGAQALLVEAVTAWQATMAGAPVVPEAPPAVLTESPGPDVLHWGPDFVPPGSGPAAAPVAAPTGPTAPVVEAFPPPQGPPVVADLLYNRPGEQLAGKVAAAREAGERPTL